MNIFLNNTENGCKNENLPPFYVPSIHNIHKNLIRGWWVLIRRLLRILCSSHYHRALSLIMVIPSRFVCRRRKSAYQRPVRSRPSRHTRNRTWRNTRGIAFLIRVFKVRIECTECTQSHWLENSASTPFITTSASPHLPLGLVMIEITTATATATGLASITTEPNAASAAPSLPTVTVSEFETILKESSKSIQLVEFSGPQSETILVKLVDGTSFGISDAKESATDPRSPLKVLATCKGYKVPTKFTGLEAALSTSTTKRKKYANNRVQEAAVREEAKRERMAQDERDRLAAVYKMQQQEEEELAAEMGVKAVVVPEVPDD
mmetsp:Transcript_4911/g.6999  ORF Transcript_4911/g.6999 Transcript_4911/m.6999 type:complete len:321 (+) Transcript_4911:454-1416(+)